MLVEMQKGQRLDLGLGSELWVTKQGEAGASLLLEWGLPCSSADRVGYGKLEKAAGGSQF